MPQEECPRAAKLQSSRGFVRGGISTVGCSAGGTSHASGRAEGAQVSPSQELLLREPGAVRLPAVLAVEAFHRQAFARRKGVFFPRYLLSVPPCYLVLAQGKYLPYESTCDT